MTFCFFIQLSRSVFQLTTPLSGLSIVFELRKNTLLEFVEVVINVSVLCAAWNFERIASDADALLQVPQAD